MKINLKRLKVFRACYFGTWNLNHWKSTDSKSESSFYSESVAPILTGSCHKRQKPQEPTPQAPIHNRKTRKDANAKVHNRYTNLT